MATCYYITKEGYDKPNKEIEELEHNVLPVKKIGYLKDFKVNAQVVDCSNIGTDVVKFGSYVKIVDLDNDRIKNIRIVGDYEADINKGLVSMAAPLGKSLLGKKVGDAFEVETPSGINAYEVVEIGA